MNETLYPFNQLISSLGKNWRKSKNGYVLPILKKFIILQMLQFTSNKEYSTKCPNDKKCVLIKSNGLTEKILMKVVFHTIHQEDMFNDENSLKNNYQKHNIYIKLVAYIKIKGINEKQTKAIEN